MNLRQLQYFKTIAELEHYTRAAEKLYVSQSNLSHSIQELEDELNVEFFVRKGRNIKLTKYGELFLPYVSQALNLLDTGVARLQDYINPNSGTVVMACFPSLAEFAPELIVRYFIRDQPGGGAPPVQPGGHLHAAAGQAAGRGDRPALLY